MLSATNLTFRINGHNLVHGVTADFEPGRLHLIMGANGAGKSTLIKMLSRLLRPTAGRVNYGQVNIADVSDRELARNRAILSQSVEVAFSMPIRELVMMGRYPHFSGHPTAADEKICDEVMQFFDVAEMAGRSYGTLSGGEKQRVHFARVLAQIWRPNPSSSDGTRGSRICNRYLFLDEPLTFLDIRHQIDFIKKVRQFASQPDVVAIGVVHDLNLAAKFADRLMLLHDGCIVADGPSNDVLTAERLNQAFGVTPVLLTNPKNGEMHLAFE